VVLILHVSDVHCRRGMIRRAAQTGPYDLVVATGDLECVDVAEELLSLDTGVAAVTGNLDNPAVHHRLQEAGVLLDGRTGTVAGLRLAGVGGLDPSTDLRRLQPVDRVEVLLTHHPPRGILDKTWIGVRAGLEEIRRLVERLRPRLHLFGHIHEARGVEGPLGGTLYVNAGPLRDGWYAVVEYPELRARLYRL